MIPNSAEIRLPIRQPGYSQRLPRVGRHCPCRALCSAFRCPLSNGRRGRHAETSHYGHRENDRTPETNGHLGNLLCRCSSFLYRCFYLSLLIVRDFEAECHPQGSLNSIRLPTPSRYGVLHDRAGVSASPSDPRPYCCEDFGLGSTRMIAIMPWSSWLRMWQ